MPVDPKETIALQASYLRQATQFQVDADRHRTEAAQATNPVDRREHEQAAISYEAQVAQMQGMARDQQAILEATHREMIAAREADQAAAAADEKVQEDTAREQARAEAAADAERLRQAERERQADLAARAAAIEQDLQAHRDRIERGRRAPGLTPFD